MCLPFALAFAGCAPKVRSYGRQEIIRLEKGQAAPWTGWLVSDADLEMLLKDSERAQW